MTLDVGTRVTHANFHLLEPGTRLRANHYGNDLVVLDNLFLSSKAQGWMHPIRTLVDQGMTVHALPKFKREAPINIDAFRQKMATVIYGQSRMHSVTTNPALDAIRALSLPHGADVVIAPGMWVHANDDMLTPRVEGGAVQVGDPNYDLDEFGIFTTVRARSPQVGGVAAAHLYRLVRCEGMTDSDLYSRPPTEDDARQVAALKGEAWRLGVAAKSAHGWCPSFEGSMSLLGLSENVTYTAEAPEGETQVPPDPHSPATTAPFENRDVLNSSADISRLPDGAVVMYPASGRYDDGTWCFLQVNHASRHDQANIMGTNSGEHTGVGIVMWNGVGQMDIPIHSPEVMDLAPVGTMVASGASRPYIKQASGRWAIDGNMSATVTTRDFFAGGRTGYRFRSFPARIA